MSNHWVHNFANLPTTACHKKRAGPPAPGDWIEVTGNLVAACRVYCGWFYCVGDLGLDDMVDAMQESTFDPANKPNLGRVRLRIEWIANKEKE